MDQLNIGLYWVPVEKNVHSFSFLHNMQNNKKKKEQPPGILEINSPRNNWYIKASMNLLQYKEMRTMNSSYHLKKIVAVERYPIVLRMKANLNSLLKGLMSLLAINLV